MPSSWAIFFSTLLNLILAIFLTSGLRAVESSLSWSRDSISESENPSFWEFLMKAILFIDSGE